MRNIASIALAALTAFSALAVSAKPADAHRYHHSGALGFGIASAVIGGIALSRHHRYYDDYYYGGYYDDYDYPYYAYRYRRPYYSSYYYYGGPRYYGHHGFARHSFRHAGRHWHH